MKFVDRIDEVARQTFLFNMSNFDYESLKAQIINVSY